MLRSALMRFGPRSGLRSTFPRFGAAGLLLALMAGLEAGAYYLPPSPWRACLQSAAKAGLIGGIADWFAVTALFRHPLGLPIPHTAILPAQQARLGDALGRFVADHILTEAEFHRALARPETPALLAGWLADPALSASLAQSLSGVTAAVLSALNNESNWRALGNGLPRLLPPAELSQWLARVLRGALREGRHQALLTALLPRLRHFLTERDQQLRTVIQDRVREQGGRLVGWAVGASIASRVLESFAAELDKVDPADSPLREALDVWLEHEVSLLETDPQRIAAIGAAWRRLWRHSGAQRFLSDVMERLRQNLNGPAGEERLVPVLQQALQSLGHKLAADGPMQTRWAKALENALGRFLPLLQPRVARFIGGVVSGWDRTSLVRRLEDRLMGDLQWVRINGTMVGFILGAWFSTIP